MLFAGQLAFNLFSDCIARAPGLIISNVSYANKMLFPLEIHPMVSPGSTLFRDGISPLA